LLLLLLLLFTAHSQLIRKSPIFDNLYYSSDIMRVSRVYELPPQSMSVNKQIAERAHTAAAKEEVGLLRAACASGGLFASEVTCWACAASSAPTGRREGTYCSSQGRSESFDAGRCSANGL
jgi:hypothetical protein